MATIIVIEPQPILRTALMQLLSAAIPELHLEGHDYARLAQEPAEQPGANLVLLSVGATDKAQELLAATQQVYDPQAIIMLSEYSGLPLQGPLPPRLAGYIPKSASPGVLQASVRLVLEGGTCFPASSVQRQPDARAGASPSPRDEVRASPHGTDAAAPQKVSEESDMLGITPRQYEVLVLLARGYPMKVVGRRLNISVATAKAHTETLYQRLNVHNRNAAVYTAIARGAKLGWSSIGGDSDTPQAA